MADDGQVRIGIYVDKDGIKTSMDEAVRVVKEGTNEMSDAADKAGKDIEKNVSKGFDTSKLQQSFKSAEAQIKSFAKSIAVAVGAFSGWVVASSNSIIRIDKMASQLGISRKAFQELDYAASKSGIAVETFGKVINRIAVDAASGGEALSKIGVSLTDATGALKTQEELLFEVLDKFAEMPDSIERTAAGISMFGEGFQKLAPLLTTGENGIKALRKQFQELGIEVDDATSKSFKDFRYALDDLGKVAKNSFNKAIGAVLPQLEDLVDYLKDSLEPGGQLNDILNRLAQIILQLIQDVLPGFLSFLEWVLNNATAVAAGITAIATAIKLLSGNWIGAIVTAVTGLTVALATLSNKAVDTKKAMQGLRNLGLNTGAYGNQSKIETDLAKARERLKIAQKEYDAQVKLVEAYGRMEDPIRKMSLTLEEGNKKYNQAVKELKNYEDALYSAKNAVSGLEAQQNKQQSAPVSLDFEIDTSDFENLGELLDGIGNKFRELGLNFKEQFVDIVSQGILSMMDGFEALGQSLVNGTNPLKSMAKVMIDTIADMISALGNLLFVRAFETYPNVDYGKMAWGTSFKVLAGVIKGLSSQIEGSYADGGIIGGNSYQGDKLLARVNSGEMILNQQQQSRLFALANGAVNSSGGVSSNIQIINNAGADVSAERSPDGRTIKVMVERITESMLKGVKGSKIMGRTYGIRQLGRR